MENQYSKFEYSMTENPSVLNGIRDEERKAAQAAWLAKYFNVLFEIECAELEGTPKQIDYANDIRRKTLFWRVGSITEYAADKCKGADKKGYDVAVGFEIVAAELNKHGMNIETMSDLVKQLTIYQNKKLINETSAKKIIERETI